MKVSGYPKLSPCHGHCKESSFCLCVTQQLNNFLFWNVEIQDFPHGQEERSYVRLFLRWNLWNKHQLCLNLISFNIRQKKKQYEN